MSIYHNIIRLLLSLLLSTSLYANESESFTDFSSIIDSFIENDHKIKEKTNLAGKQRMLTQRITKLALLIDSNIKSKKNIKKLQKVTNLYSQNLTALQSDNEESTQQLEVIKKLWRPFQKNIEKVIDNKKGIEYIIQHNEELLEASNKLVTIYETSNSNLNYLDKAKLHIVNLAGRQRMLLEKMSKEKILLFRKNNTYKKKLQTSIYEFDSALKKLRSGDSSKHIPKVGNPKLIKKLNIIEPLWKKLKPLYTKEDLNQKELLTLIHQSSLLLLESNIYVKLTELEQEY